MLLGESIGLRAVDDVVPDPDGTPPPAPKGKDESMERVPSSTGVPNQDPRPDYPRFTGPDVVETTDGSFLHLGQASHLFHLTVLPDGGDVQRSDAVDPLPLGDRPDIDSAMLEALRRALVCDDGLSGSMRAVPVRDDRPDIDSAMLEALRRATVTDPDVRDD